MKNKEKPMKPLPRLLNYREVSEILGFKPQTIRKWVSAREIECVKIGSSVQFTPEVEVVGSNPASHMGN